MKRLFSCVVMLAAAAVSACPLLIVSLVATSVPLRAADSILVVTMSGLTFSGTAMGTETINISFNWDATTKSIEPGSMSVLASGAIGESFNFGSTGSVSGGQGFEWTDATGDNVSVNTCGFNCGTFPSTGLYNTIDITLLCGSSDNCSADSFNGVHPSKGAFTVTTAKVTPVEAIAYNDLNTLITGSPAKVSAWETVVTTIVSQLNPFGCGSAEQDLNTVTSDLGMLQSALKNPILASLAPQSVLNQLLSAGYKTGIDLISLEGDVASCNIPDYVQSDVNVEIAGIEAGNLAMIGLAAVVLIAFAV